MTDSSRDRASTNVLIIGDRFRGNHVNALRTENMEFSTNFESFGLDSEYLERMLSRQSGAKFSESIDSNQ